MRLFADLLEPAVRAVFLRARRSWWWLRAVWRGFRSDLRAAWRDPSW